jgi:hypothetical protein
VIHIDPNGAWNEPSPPGNDPGGSGTCGAGTRFRQAPIWQIRRVGASEVRKAENEATFRDANEEIERVREELSLVDGKTPFFCECEDANCRDVVQLDLREYEAVRAQPTTFLVAPGHPYSSGHLVEDCHTYLIVQKDGTAGRIARETDPRGHRVG